MRDAPTHPRQNNSAAQRFRVGVDTGGTFTDLVLIDPDGVVVATHKRLSTPADPSAAVLEGIDALLDSHGGGLTRDDILATHGSTVATNALLEASHERVDRPTVFVTTAGFEDTLHLARQHRPELYALVPRRPDPPIPRRDCVGVRERLSHDGREIEPLTYDAIRDAVGAVTALNPGSVAVSSLHSYANPEHEQRLAAALREALGDDVPVTVSHELHPQFREYERAAVCVINAVVAPRMTRYLRKLEAGLPNASLRIMGSHGGTMSVDEACREPVRTILSGPAGGVRGAAALGEHLITLDMGGTSTDVAVIDTEPTRSTDHEAAGLPVQLPMLDIHTVGAGGGSIAWLDAGGALRVGPRSAGADPGPACYGRQTGEPLVTVTDAHVALGHLPDGYPLGDGLTVQRELAIDAVNSLAKRANLASEDLAAGVLRIAELNMARAVHRVTLQRGRDPRRYALVPFGGAGGLHACGLAEQLGITTVRVPVYPGLLSAVGMLAAPPLQTATVSMHRTIRPDEPPPDLSEWFVSLDASIRTQTKVKTDPTTSTFEASLRYTGQSHEITVPVADPDRQADLIDRFHAEHQRLFGYANPQRPVELVLLRVWSAGPERAVVHRPIPVESSGPASLRDIMIRRDDLPAGFTRPGPFTVSEYSATTLVRDGWTLTVETDGTLRLERDP